MHSPIIGLVQLTTTFGVCIRIHKHSCIHRLHICVRACVCTSRWYMYAYMCVYVRVYASIRVQRECVYSVWLRGVRVHIYHGAGAFEVELQRRRMPDITYIPDQVSGTIMHKTLKMRRHSIDNTLATHYQHVSNTLATPWHKTLKMRRHSIDEKQQHITNTSATHWQHMRHWRRERTRLTTR